MVAENAIPQETLSYICFLDTYSFQHYNDVIMSAMATQITSLSIVYSTVYSRHRWKKTSKVRVTGHWAGNSPLIGEFPAQRASNADSFSIWWRHHRQCAYLQNSLIISSKPKNFLGIKESIDDAFISNATAATSAQCESSLKVLK